MTGFTIDLSDVTKTYQGPSPVRALRSVSLTIEQGEFVAIVGPSGSGKSTLMSLLGLLDHPTSGSYKLLGQDTRDLSEAELCRLRASKLGFVFQAFHLIEHRTIEENVALGQLYRNPTKGDDRSANALDVLELVGLAHRVGFTPATLSGGERQRVAIARALVGSPSLLLCDEPTGNLDSVTASSILDLLESLRSPDLTIVMITHDPIIAQRSDRIVSMLDGELVS